jgi:hypothetical protein
MLSSGAEIQIYLKRSRQWSVLPYLFYFRRKNHFSGLDLTAQMVLYPGQKIQFMQAMTSCWIASSVMRFIKAFK